MSSTSAPFGLRPYNHGSGGLIRPTPGPYTITTGYSSAIYQNQPVKIIPSSTGEGTIGAAAVNDRFIGTFQGVEWTDTSGRRQYDNKWTANTAGTDIVAYVTEDPNIIYEIQANAALTVADIGKQYDFTTAGTTSSALVGFSSMALDVASVAANAALQVLNIVPGPDNAWGDAYPIVQVRISEHQMVADVAGF